MKAIKRLRLIAAAAGMALLTAAVPIAAVAENGPEITDTQITVRASEIKEKGTFRAVQAALDIARYSATNDNRYRVVVEPGTYDLTRALHLYSNTELYLKGVTLKRHKESCANMLRTGDYDTEKSGAEGYDEYCNLTVTGGVFDGSATANTVVKAAHTTNLRFEGTSFKNVKNGHIMEIAGVNGFTVKKCSFKDQRLDPDDVGYEAIQLDILKKGHIMDCRSEDLAMKNVLIEGCTFDNVPRGVGTHTMIVNNPFTNIKIKNNTFKNITSVAVQTMNWKNSEISGNIIDKAPRGIALYSILGGGQGAFKSSDIAAEGKTDSHVSNKYSGAFDSHITIADNTITGCGAIKDKFADYVPAGISVIGTTLSKTSKINAQDGSGGLPKGDYSMRGVTVKNNTIDANGYGIRMINAKNCDVLSNTVACTDNKHYKNDFHGIQVYQSYINRVKGNTVSKAASNGISVYKSTVPVIENNEVDNSKYCGICCDSSTVRHINYNTIIKTVSDGILFKKSNGNKKISENYITDTGGRGVFVKGKSKAGAIDKNIIFATERVCIERMNDSKGTIGNGNSFKATTVKSVSLNTDNLTMGIGETYPLTARVAPSNAKSRFIWSSSDNSVAVADINGRVTAKRTGSATITVTASNNVSKTCKVEVKQKPRRIAINASMLTLGQGEEFDFNSKLSPHSSASHRVTYTSNNNGAVSVSSTGGVITGKSVGTATIVAKTYNGKAANCNVIVKAAPYAVWFTEDYLQMGQGETYHFQVHLPDNTASHHMVYRSSNKNAVEINAATGEAYAKAAGTTEITATAYNGLQAHCTVTVQAAPERVDLSTKTINLHKGEKSPLTCSFPKGSASCELVYMSSDPKVCHVDKDGVVTAKNRGKATVSVRTYNGRIDFCEIVVT